MTVPRVLPETVSDLAQRLRAYALPAPHDDRAEAAVATVVKPAVTGGLEVLYIKRAEYEGDRWSGHVAFPGGKREPFDGSLLATALRETREELALALPPESLVTRLPDLIGPRVNIQVAHFVFALETPDVPLQPNAEVEDAVWVPLRTLVEKEFAGTFEYEYAGSAVTLPSIRLGKYTLWGMTLRLSGSFTEALIGTS
jgi:8-oxo-dGTP pyrophosphatase MutT (NUDIX family)